MIPTSRQTTRDYRSETKLATVDHAAKVIRFQGASRWLSSASLTADKWTEPGI
jgi:hypothetical protein